MRFLASVLTALYSKVLPPVLQLGGVLQSLVLLVHMYRGRR